MRALAFGGFFLKHAFGPCGDNGALAFVQMPAVQVTRKDDGQRRADAVPFNEARLDAGDLARAQAISPIEHKALVDEDRFAQAVLVDVLDQEAQISIFHHWKQFRRWMDADGLRGVHGQGGNWR